MVIFLLKATRCSTGEHVHWCGKNSELVTNVTEKKSTFLYEAIVCVIKIWWKDWMIFFYDVNFIVIIYAYVRISDSTSFPTCCIREFLSLWLCVRSVQIAKFQAQYRVRQKAFSLARCHSTKLLRTFRESSRRKFSPKRKALRTVYHHYQVSQECSAFAKNLKRETLFYQIFK